MSVRPLRFRPPLRLREDLWGRLLGAPRPRFLPLLLAATRRLRPPRFLLRPLLPPVVPFRGRRPRPPSPHSRSLRSLALVRGFYQLLRRRQLAALVRRAPSPPALAPLLESLPVPLLVRSLLVRSPFQARQLLAHGQVFLEGRPVSHFHPLRPGQMLRLLGRTGSPPPAYGALGPPPPFPPSGSPRISGGFTDPGRPPSAGSPLSGPVLPRCPTPATFPPSPLMFARLLRRARFLLLTRYGQRRLPRVVLRPGHGLWLLALLALAQSLRPSSSFLGVLLPALLFAAVFRVSHYIARRGTKRVYKLLLPLTLLLLCLLPLAILFCFLGIFSEQYYIPRRHNRRHLRTMNHLPFRPPHGIRLDPVVVGMLLGAAILMTSSRVIRTSPQGGLDKYRPDNWDIAHWENVEVLGDEHNDAAAEFYLDRASAAIRLTFTTPVLDYYLERLIQFDEGLHWWLPDRPPPFYGEKPFRASCWGGVPRYAPRDLYFVDPMGPAPQYHPRGGYHPIWVNRQASLLLGKQPLPEVQMGPGRPLWLSPRGVVPGPVPVSRLVGPTAVQRQQRLLSRLEEDEVFREYIEKTIKRFRSRETAMNAMQRYLYHPDAKGERDHRHMRIREALDEGDAQDRMMDAAQEASDENQDHLHFLSLDEFEYEFLDYEEELLYDLYTPPLEGEEPCPYSAFEDKPFVPYPTAPLHGA